MAGVQSVERAFAVLRAVATGPAGVSELARRVELPTSTTARLLGTLESIGAVVRGSDGLTYRVGAAISELGASADDTAGLLSTSRLYLAELVDHVGETAGLSVAEGDEVHYLDHVEATNQVQVRDWTGTRLPLHVVSSGLVLLAGRSAEGVARYLAGPLRAYTRRTVTDPAALAARLEEVRRVGWAWTVEEFHEGIASVASPVTSAGGAVLAALHCHGPSYRFPGQGTQDEIGRVVAGAAARLSARLA